ncbi:MAG TPA: response regulator transcription factor [Gaiellaceae bacterium]|nr:response regulator transcription factor [Gaiellaceae bacterium]
MSEHLDRLVRVLIAEDDPALRLVMTEVIGTVRAFELVAAVADADEAVAVARHALPDVALVDVRMPGGGGLAATRGILQASAATRVIAFTGHDDDSVVAEMFEAGIAGYLVKGGTIEEIVATIRAAADGTLQPRAREL